MRVRKYHPEALVSVFVESDLRADVHAHPPLELIVAQSGTFRLEIPGQSFSDLRFAALRPNCPHAVDGRGAVCEFLFAEVGLCGWKNFCQQFLGLPPETAAHVSCEALAPPAVAAWDEWQAGDCASRLDPRVLKCIRLIEQDLSGGLPSLPKLARAAQLSPGRLSHLFVSEMGLPIQRYIRWRRLKASVHHILRDRMNLTEAALAAGFFDSAHFSKAFKEMLGIKPSAAYLHSRIVQDAQ